MDNNKELAGKIIELLGGKENITYVTHCITRLRFNLKDEKKVQVEKLRALEGVGGYTVQGGQHQVIIGTKVKKVYDEVLPLAGNLSEEEPEQKKKFSLMMLLDTLTSIIAPTIPAFCACGMMKVVLLLLTTSGICTGTEGTYQVFEMLSDVAFYFLPILIAMSSAKRFKVDTGLAVVLAGLLVYPSLVSMVEGGESLKFLGISVPMYSYSSTIFPALLGVYLLSKIYKLFDKLIKLDAVKMMLVPLLSIGVTAPITLLVVAPLANWGANGLANIFSWLLTTVGPIAGFIIGFLMPVMTLTGLHQSLTPVELMEMSTFGYSRILPIEFFHNLAEAGAAIGNGFVSKNKKWKTISFETGVTALIGVSEPALYSVMVKDRRAMLSAMIGNGLGGFFGVMFLVRGYAFVWPNIFSFASFMGGESPMRELCMLVLCGVITFASALIIRIILGNKELKFRKAGKTKVSDGLSVEKSASSQEIMQKNKEVELKAFISGKVLPIEKVKDNAYSTKTLGDGVAIIPEGGILTAPCDGIISVAMEESRHAVGITLENGAEIIIHAGLDTVRMKGEGFRLFVSEGDKVRAGDKLLSFDVDLLKRRNVDNTCVLVHTNGEGYQDKKNSDCQYAEQNKTVIMKISNI